MLVNWLRHMEFAYPFSFGLLGLLPLMIWWYLQQGRQPSATFSTVKGFNVRTWKNLFRHLPFIFLLLAVASLVIALAKPRVRNDQRFTEGEGIDIVLCMDVSGSMGSRDIPPSRMEAAKEVATEFVRSRPVDRIGLVIFSGESFTQCPVTTDRNTLITQIQSLESRKHLKDGTVIGEGLATAADRLSKTKGKSKVIILLTDGKEDPPETRLIDPLTALEIARTKGIKVYTIGMGAGPSSVEEQTGKTTVKKPVQADFLDDQLLEKIANETGGKFFRARDKSALQDVYRQIDKMEKSKVEIQSLRKYEERFIPFIIAALVFVFLGQFLQYSIFRQFP